MTRSVVRFLTAAVAFLMMVGAALLFVAHRPSTDEAVVMVYVDGDTAPVLSVVRKLPSVAQVRTVSADALYSMVSSSLAKDLYLSPSAFPQAIRVVLSGPDISRDLERIAALSAMKSVVGVVRGRPVHRPGTPAWYRWLSLLLILGATMLVYSLIGEAAERDEEERAVVEHLGGTFVQAHRNTVYGGAVLSFGFAATILAVLGMAGILSVQVALFVGAAALAVLVVSVFAHAWG